MNRLDALHVSHPINSVIDFCGLITCGKQYMQLSEYFLVSTENITKEILIRFKFKFYHILFKIYPSLFTIKMVVQ